LESVAAAVVVVIAAVAVFAVLAASTSQQLPLLSLPFLTLFNLPWTSCHAYLALERPVSTSPLQVHK
jgi:hypothetical protein